MMIDNLSLEWLDDDAQPEARTFCLRIIKDVYHIDYRPDWHADLDSLLLARNDNWFSATRHGGLLVVRDEDGRIVAAGGFHALENKPSTKERLCDRYGDATKVCQIVRVYLDPRVRRKGLGTMIVAVLERMASDTGYKSIYLHADAQTPGTLSFWRSQGYCDFGQFSYPSERGTDTSVDFEKLLQAGD